MQYDIAFVNSPRNPDGKYGNLKTRDGLTLMCPVALLGMFQAGQVVDINTRSEVWKGRNGEPDKTMTIVASGPNGSRPTPQQAATGAAIAKAGAATAARVRRLTAVARTGVNWPNGHEGRLVGVREGAARW